MIQLILWKSLIDYLQKNERKRAKKEKEWVKGEQISIGRGIS